MKAQATKFAQLPKLPKLQAGGFMSKLGKFAGTAGGQAAIGVGLNATNSLLANAGQPAGPLGAPASNLGFEKVQSATAKRDKGFGVAQSIGDAAIQSGFAPAMIGGLALKGVAAGAKALGLGSGKVKEATDQYENNVQKDAQMSMARQGALNKNMISGFKALAYGKKGMKLKTSKYSKPC